MADIYNPSDGIASNLPFSNRGKPSVGRRYYFDRSGTKRWRQFISHQEACECLVLTDDRRGHEPLIINFGGTILGSGYISGGVNVEYWWRDGYADEDLIPKENSVFEEIPFPTATGIINIDFTLNSRAILFPNPDIRAYIVEAVDDEEELTEIVGFVPVITKVDGVITNLKASYIAGNVLVLLTNN